MKLSTFTNSNKAVIRKNTRRGAFAAYVSILTSTNDVCPPDRFVFSSNNVLVTNHPGNEFISTYRILANMYNVDYKTRLAAHRALGQVGWLINTVKEKDRNKTFDTVALSYRSIFGFSRRIFAMSSRYNFLRGNRFEVAAHAENNQVSSMSQVFSAPYIRYRRIRWGSIRSRQSRTKLRNIIYVSGLWRAIDKLRKLSNFGAVNEEIWWRNCPDVDGLGRVLAPTKKSPGMSEAYYNSWFTNKMLRTIKPRHISKFVRWSHLYCYNRGNLWITPTYMDKISADRRYPRTWRKTRRYARLKSQKDSWINRVPGENYFKRRLGLHRRTGSTFDGSYSQLVLVGGNRYPTPAAARNALRNMHLDRGYLRALRRVLKRGYHSAIRYRNKNDRTHVFLTSVPRDADGKYAVAPRIGYNRLRRFAATRRTFFRTAKIMKMRGAGEFYYNVATSARTLFFKRLRNFKGGSAAMGNIVRMRNFCKINYNSWRGVTFGYFSSQVRNPAMKGRSALKSQAMITGAINNNPIGFFVNTVLTRWNPYDLVFFKPEFDLKYLTARFHQWSAQEALSKSYIPVKPGAAFPTVLNLGEHEGAISDLKERSRLGRKLGFIDKFLAYAILSGSRTKSQKVTNPVRFTFKPAGSRWQVNLGRNKVIFSKSIRSRSRLLALSAARKALRNVGVSKPVVGALSALAADRLAKKPQQYSATFKFINTRKPTVGSKWLTTAIGLKQFELRDIELNNFKVFYNRAKKLKPTPKGKRLPGFNLQPKFQYRGEGKKVLVSQCRQAVYTIKNPYTVFDRFQGSGAGISGAVVMLEDVFVSPKRVIDLPQVLPEKNTQKVDAKVESRVFSTTSDAATSLLSVEGASREFSNFTAGSACIQRAKSYRSLRGLKFVKKNRSRFGSFQPKAARLRVFLKRRCDSFLDNLVNISSSLPNTLANLHTTGEVFAAAFFRYLSVVDTSLVTKRDKSMAEAVQKGLNVLDTAFERYRKVARNLAFRKRYAGYYQFRRYVYEVASEYQNRRELRKGFFLRKQREFRKAQKAAKLKAKAPRKVLRLAPAKRLRKVPTLGKLNLNMLIKNKRATLKLRSKRWSLNHKRILRQYALKAAQEAIENSKPRYWRSNPNSPKGGRRTNNQKRQQSANLGGNPQHRKPLYKKN